MLDPVVHEHHDKIDEIVKDFEDDIDTVLKEIDIDAIIDDPYGALSMVIEVFKEKLLDDHMPRAIVAGIEFSKQVGKAKAIKVDDTNNPQANEAIGD
jgi:hypothetical protein